MINVSKAHPAPGEEIGHNVRLAVDEHGRVRPAGLNDSVVGRTPTEAEAERLPDPDPGTVHLVWRTRTVRPQD